MAGEADEVGVESEVELDEASRTLLGKWSFGPSFFLLHLARFVRDECPPSDEVLPRVRLHLVDGTAFDLCHVVGVSPTWVAAAVYVDEPRAPGGMRTELIPYAMVARVTVSQAADTDTSIGFDLHRESSVLQVPELDLGTAAGLSAALGEDPG